MAKRRETITKAVRKESQEELSAFLECWKSTTLGYLTGASSAGPAIVGYLSGVFVESPTTYAAAIVTTSLITVVACFLATSRRAPEFSYQWAIRFCWFGVLALLLYALLWASVTESVDGERIVTGYRSQIANQAVDDGDVVPTAKDLILFFTADRVNVIWPARNLFWVLLVSAACLANMFITGGLSLFLVSRFVQDRNRVDELFDEQQAKSPSELVAPTVSKSSEPPKE